MSQQNFTPVEGSTHLDARNIYNANADDAEARLAALESNPGGGAVDSVNTQTGVVVLDADDISDATTTNKFATQAQLDKADSALQPSEPTLESVTTNGATTVNDIEVGRIVMAGNTLGALAVDSLAIGGSGNSALGEQSEVLGGGGSSATGTGSTIVGGKDSNNSGNWAIIAGGRGHTNTAAARSGTLAGEHTTITHTDSAMLAVKGTNAVNKQSQANRTAHVDNLHIFEGGFKMPTGATDTYVLTTDGNGVGTWQAAAGGPAGPSGTTLSGTTSNNTQTEIFVDGVASSRMTIATNTTWMFSAMVAARSATESAGYKIEGVIKNDGGTTSLVGIAVKTVFAEEDATWDITVEADDTNDALVFKVTGDSADSVTWEVTANKTEAS